MRTLLLLVLCTTVTSTGRAQQPSSSAADFRPFEFLVGSCWTGTFPDGKQTDEHCFAWMLDKKFIRDQHVVRNGSAPYAGETIYGWDAAAKQIAFAYYSSAGFILKGTVKPAGDTLVFPSKLTTAQGEIEMRSTWIRRGADAYHVADTQKTADGWKTTREMDYKRTK